MGKLKLKNYPKKPKATASVQVKENYLAKVKDVDKQNAKIKAENAKSEALNKKIAKIGKAS